MKRIAFLAICAALGLAAALGYTAKPALAWDWNTLPAGYGVSSYQTICHVATDPCVGGEGSICNHVTITAPGTALYQKSETDCVNPTFQADIDAFVDATICVVNPAAGGSACVPTTTAPPTTSDTAPTTTVPPPDPAPAPTPVPTVTVTTTIVDPTINDRLAALEAQYAALAARVDAIANANTASWTAFIDATNAGASVADAALAARSAGLNAIYQL